MIVSFHRLAAKELKRAFRWYHRRSPMAARRFVEAMDRAIAKIQEDPARWPRFRQRFRWIKTHRFPFVLYYEILGADDIMIMAVAHARRRLGYWARRTPDHG